MKALKDMNWYFTLIDDNNRVTNFKIKDENKQAIKDALEWSDEDCEKRMIFRAEPKWVTEKREKVKKDE